MQVSIVIPSFNGVKLLQESLPPLINECQSCGYDTEIIVVDDGSSDDTAEFLSRNYPSITYIHLQKNMGFSYACNLGAKKAKGKVLILLNNDMLVQQGFIENLVSHFEDKDLFSVAARVITEKTEKGFESGKTTWFWSFGLIKVKHLQVQADKGICEILYAGGGASAFCREKFLQLQGFDLLFHPFYGEDLDLSFRAWRMGWKVLFEPQSRVIHRHRSTIASLFPINLIYSIVYRNYFLFFWKHCSGLSFWLKHIFLLPFNMFRMSFSKGFFGLKGLILALKKIPQLFQSRKEFKQKTPIFSFSEVLKKTRIK